MHLQWGLLLAWWLGLWQPPDRAALRAIWDALVPDTPGRRVLFVGVRPYTRGLTRSRRRAMVVTIDRDPSMRYFGAKRHHVAAVEDLAALGEAPFDLVIANGVLGWGVDTLPDAEGAITAMAGALRPGGLLVLGVNEERHSTPPLHDITALRALRPAAPPPFGTHRHVVPSPFEGTHTFLFFERS